MKKSTTKFFKLALALVIGFTMITQSDFIMTKPPTDNFGIGNKVFNTTSDLNTDIPVTSTDGVGGFGEKSADGRIWVDKSVADKEDGTFNVKLSALTQEFTSTKAGSSANTTAADVVFVLDGSLSMIWGKGKGEKDIKDGDNSLYRLQAMVKATNEAIAIISKANPKNRVAIYWYSGASNGVAKAETLLPMDSYTIDTGETKYLEWCGDTSTSTNPNDLRKVFYGRSLKNSDGDKLDNGKDSYAERNGKEVLGGTPTQKGMAFALDKTIKGIDNSANIGERKPYVFLLSDGGASLGYEDWTDADKMIAQDTATLGDGSEGQNYIKDITAGLILTSAYMKDKLNIAYKEYNEKNSYQATQTKLYTVGLGSDINGPYVQDYNGVNTGWIKYAWVGLQPLAIQKAIDNIPYWSESQVWDGAQITAAQNVKESIGKYVDNIDSDGSKGLTKYKDETNYNYGDYYSYASNYADLEGAFKELATDVEEATKVVQPPVESDPSSHNSSIHFHDKIGEGMKLNGDLTLNINGTTNPIKGIISASSVDGDVYEFPGLKSQAIVVENNDGTLRSVDWYIAASDLKECTYVIKSDGTYTAKDPFYLAYDLILDDSVKASDKTTYFTNQFTVNGSSKVADTFVTFKPTKDNPYYFYTNKNTGKIGTLSSLGINDVDTDISHYVKGEAVDAVDDLATISDVYITTDMANAMGSPYSIEEVGFVADSLKPADSGMYTSQFETAVRKSIKNCKKASDATDTGNMFAFKLGIQKEHNHVVNKANNANLSNTTLYLSKESFDDGQVKMLLGNNGRLDITHDITKTTANSKIVPGGLIEYKILVTNYTNNDSNNVTISDDVPSGLTDINNTTDVSVGATYNLTGNKAEWSNVKIAKNASITLSLTAKVPTNASVGKMYENEAKIISLNGSALATPATSNKTESETKAGILINVNKDNTAWNDHGKTLKVKAIDGTVYTLTDDMPNGDYTIIDGTTDTNIKIVIADRSGSATLNYYTLTLNKGVGIDSVKEIGNIGVVGANANEFIFLKGQIASVEAIVSTGYEFIDWSGGTTNSVPTDKSKTQTTIAVNDTVGLIANAKRVVSKISLDVTLNGGGYTGFDVSKVTYVNDDTNTVINDINAVPNGKYTVYVDGEKTNVGFVSDGTDKTVKLEYFTLTVTGQLGVTGTSGSGDYLKGTDVSIEAYLDTEYQFTQWDGPVANGNTINKNHVVVNGQTTVTAKAEKPANTGINVIVGLNLNDSEWKDYTKTITIRDSDGNIVDSGNVPVGAYTIYDGEASTGTNVVVSPEDVAANRDRTITLDYYSLLLNKDLGIGTVQEENGNYVFLKGSLAYINATLENGYQFTNWTDKGGNIIYNTAQNDIVMNRKVELTAHAREIHAVNIDVTLDGSSYTSYNKTITLKEDSGNIINDFTQVPNGNYTVLVDGRDTYLKVNVNGSQQNAQLEYFTLSLHKGTGIRVVLGDGTYLKGDTATIDTVVESGYTFEGWSGSSLIMDQKKEIIVNKTLEYTANAKRIEGKILLDVTLNGTNFVDFDKSKITYKNEDTNEIVTDLNNVPRGKYTVYVNDEKTNVKFTADETDKIVKLEYFTLDVKGELGIIGTVGSGNYLKGTEVSIEAYLDTGYHFTKWAGTVENDNTINENKVIVNDKTTVTAKADKPVNKGIDVNVTLNLDDSEWKDNVKNITIRDKDKNVIDSLEVPAGTYTIYDGETSTEVKVVVTKDDVTNNKNKNVTLDYYSLKLNKDAGIETVKEKNDKYMFLKGTTAYINATMKNGYQFTNWTDQDGIIMYDNAENSFVMNKKIELTAHARGVYEVRVDVALDGGSYASYDKTITLKDDKGNIICDLTQVPNGNYTVLVDGKATYLKVNVEDSQQSAKLEYFTVTLHKGEGIKDVSGNGIYLKGDKITINSTVDAGYIFKGWSGASSILEHKKEIIVNETQMYIANAEISNVNHQIIIDINKDGESWINHDRDITLKDHSGNSITALDQVKDGVYTIYVDGISTGRTITIQGEDANVVLNYYTLILENGTGIEETIGAGVYLEGSKISIDAKEMSGYVFSKWTGTNEYEDSQQIIHINKSYVLKANAIKKTNGYSPLTSDETRLALIGCLLISSSFVICLFMRKKITNKL